MRRYSKKMSADEFSRATQYKVGDTVQIRPDGDVFAGRVGTIIGITVYRGKSWSPEFSYQLKLSDNEGISVPCNRLRIIREAGSGTDVPESKSQYLPMCITYYPRVK